MQLHQVIAGASPHDAITDHALRLQSWLRQLGFSSEIYAGHIETGFSTDIRPWHSYRHQGEPYLICHHSLGSDVADDVCQQPCELILVYHNVTPPEFFEAVDPAKAAAARRGREQLAQLRGKTAVAVCASHYNQADIKTYGFANTAVLPLDLDESQYQYETNQEIVQRKNGRPLLLFVGRLAPNKRQEDLVKLLYAYKQIETDAQLALVGSLWSESYVSWIHHIATELDVVDSLWLTGRVSQADLVSYYRTADLYVSMSEHEGFGKPYIESMYHDLPIVAYHEGGTADTLGGTGVQFTEKEYVSLAGLIQVLRQDRPFQQRLIARQRERLAYFMPQNVYQRFTRILNQLPGLTLE